MKLAISAIYKNEANHITRWLDALQPELKPGDSITVLDTGSTDGGDRLFALRGVSSHHATISPWRFDVARNLALALAPGNADAVWALDLDEVPQPGWRDAIEGAWHDGLHRLRYKFIWSHQANGDPGVVFWADKLFARHGAIWRGVAHEWLAFPGVDNEQQLFVDGLVVHHYQDTSIDRGTRDLDLMERAVADMPNDARLRLYYARQLYFMGDQAHASEEYQRYLAHPDAVWRHERSEAMLMLASMDGNEAWKRQWQYRAIAECPERREVWYDAARFEAACGDLALAIVFLERCAGLPDEEYYLSRPEVRGDGPARLRREIKARLYEGS